MAAKRNLVRLVGLGGKPTVFVNPAHVVSVKPGGEETEGNFVTLVNGYERVRMPVETIVDVLNFDQPDEYDLNEDGTVVGFFPASVPNPADQARAEAAEQRSAEQRKEIEDAAIRAEIAKGIGAKPGDEVVISEQQEGETDGQYRARLMREAKAAKKAREDEAKQA